MKFSNYMNDTAMKEAKKRNRILYRMFSQMNFVIDILWPIGVSDVWEQGLQPYGSQESKTWVKKKFEHKVMH